MENPRDHCIRCGECCKKSSPTLHIQDLPLIEQSFIKTSSLFTIRKGELVRDNINDELLSGPHEMIKIRTMNGKRDGCLFYDEVGKACSIYKERPVQCSALKCWDTTDFMKIFKSTNLKRKDIIRDGLLLGLIEAHERRCSYLKLEKYVRQIESEGEKAVEKIIDALKFDFQLRPFISEKAGIDPVEMDFIFGRPLIRTIIMFGLKVDRQPDGSFFLTAIKKEG